MGVSIRFRLVLQKFSKSCLSKNTFQQENSPTMKGKLLNLSLAHKNKLKKEVSLGKLEGTALKSSYNQWLDSTKSNILQKLHFIIGHGILRPELR